MRIARHLLQFVVVLCLGVLAPLSLNASPARAATFSDTAGSQFQNDIEWLASQGITNGCGGGRFCPTDPVTREQMASFLVRWRGLPASATDFFVDDEASPHETDINALAASGITHGCGGSVFCPSAIVLRDQMAAFIGRAIGLSYGGGSDFFPDDSAGGLENDVDRLYFAGITNGCGGNNFCAAAAVTREQMAAFIHRAAGGASYRGTPGISGASAGPGSLSFAPGTYRGVSFDAGYHTATVAVTATVPSASSAPTDQVAYINGVAYAHVGAGTFAGRWVKTNAAFTVAVGDLLPQITSASLWNGTTAHQQVTSIYCVPASTKTMLEMMGMPTGSSQATIYNYGRTQMGYAINGAGHDPQAWAHNLNYFSGGRVNYVDSTYATYDAAIKAAVKSMRLTGKPVGITINNGTHAWVLVGWSATADPAYTDNFSVSSVQVVAPYMAWTDPAPGSWFTYSYMSGKMTPYYEAERWTRWNGTYVLVRPTG